MIVSMCPTQNLRSAAKTGTVTYSWIKTGHILYSGESGEYYIAVVLHPKTVIIHKSQRDKDCLHQLMTLFKIIVTCRFV